MSATPLQRALEVWGQRDEWGGFQAAGAMLFPEWQAKRSCRAPHREDKAASFSVYQNDKGEWRFKDFANEEQGSLVGFVMLAGMNEASASRWLMEAGGACDRLTLPPRPAPIKQPRQPYTLSGAELGACVGMAESLLRHGTAIDGIAKARGWQAETIRQLALCPCLGLHEGKLVYIYSTAAKKRLKPLTPARAASFTGVPFTFLFGKPHSLWRGDLVSRATETIHVTEGETAAISLIDAGMDNGASEIVLAVASASAWWDEWAPLFRGRAVVIWPDADDAGEKLKARVIASLSPVARSIEVADTKGVQP